jgi:hypothetical protein
MNLYQEAAEFGLKKANEELAGQEPEVGKLLARARYWTAWWAGRRASDALLDEAIRVGVTPEQWEALRKKAAEVAFD